MKVSLFLSGISIAALMASPARAQTSQSPTDQPAPAAQQPPTASPDETVQDIIVTGIRGSIARSIETKRSSANIVDAVSAEDIGKLPDQNVAESLGRVTGVQITRREGEGSNFTVRGISLNRVEINGRSFVGPTQDASPALETINPEILSGIEVTKSPSARMVEGALGATVNLKTRRPLDGNANLVVSGRAQGVYADAADKVGYRASALVAKQFGDGTFGILGGIAYGRIFGKGEGFQSGGYTRTNAIDGNGDGIADPNLIRPNRIVAQIEDRSDRRITANGALQWKPDQDTEVVLEGTYSYFKRERALNYYQTLLNNNFVPGSVTVLSDGTVAKGRVTGVTLRPLAYDAPIELRSLNLGASARRRFDRLEVTIDGSYSKGRGSDSTAGPTATGAPFTFVVVNKASAPVTLDYDLTSNRNFPNFSVASPANLKDPKNFQLFSVFDGQSLARNRGYDGRIDFAYDIDAGPLSMLRAGARYENIQLIASDPQSTPAAAALLAAADKNGDGIIDISELPALNYDNSSSGNFLSDVSGNFPRDFLTGTVDNVAGRANVGLGDPARTPLSERKVDQKTIAGFVQADLKGDVIGVPWSANLGVRYVHTERTSSGFAQGATAGVFTPTSVSPKFTDWLPSANLSLNLTDKLVLRLAAAKVIARPPLSNVAAGITVNLVALTASAGNPLLQPFKATQYDASLEWYFGRASILSVALFNKDVSSFTTNTTTSEIVPGNERFGPLLVSRPQNGTSGKVRGVEIGFQHAFKFLPSPLDGLGTQISYTYADSSTPVIEELTGQRLPLQNLSKNSVSAVLFYEKGPVSARVAYSYRSKYLLVVQSAAIGGSLIHAPYGQLDASATLRINDRIQLTFDAINLTKPFDRFYQGTANRTREALVSDRRFQFGVLAKF